MKPLFAFVIFCSVTFDHDVRMARFRVEAQGDAYQLEITFDRVDILEAIYASPVREGAIIEQIEAYVRPRLSFRFDGQPIAFDFESIEYTAENILIVASLQASKTDIQTIEVVNTCLLKEVEGHLNIMEFFLQDARRYFRLHDERTTTTVTYNSQPG